MATDTVQAFEQDDLLAQHGAAGDLYLEFLRVPAMSLGIYRLPAGAEDLQQPHQSDEAYYVISGRSRFTCDGTTVPVQPGTTLYAAAQAVHRFHDIAEDLTILVFFAPAEPA